MVKWKKGGIAMKQRRIYVIASTVACALAMSFVDGVIQPPYGLKSFLKVVLFLLVPLGYFGHFRAWDSLKALFLLKKRELAVALALGIGAFGVITGGYMVISRFFSLEEAIWQMTAEGGVNPGNFLYVSFYIALVNSMLEEFFFRGYAFLNLKSLTSRSFAYFFSAVLFAVYHLGMVSGNGNPLIWGGALILLTASGLILNALNEHSGSILTSWLLHMCANLGINAVGFYVFGMI